jgi:hypothetical protein
MAGDGLLPNVTLIQAMKRLSFILLALLAPLSLHAAERKPYPLKTCIVTDNALGSMGGEQRIAYEGREIKFCCKPCVAKFRKNPDRYLSKLR